MTDYGYLRETPEVWRGAPLLTPDALPEAGLRDAYGAPVRATTALRQLPTPVLSQNGPTCVVHVVVQALRYRMWRQGVAKPPMPSRIFLSYLARSYRRWEAAIMGTYPRDTFSAAQREGWCDETVWPHDPKLMTTVPDASAFKQAYARSEEGRAKLGLGDMAFRRIEGDRKAAVQQAIASDYPVAFGLSVDEGFVKYKRGEPAWGYKGPAQGDHYILAGEYDEEGVWALSSWGSKYGEDGGIRVRWDTLTDTGLCYDFYVLTSAPRVIV